ncbi:MULTISPECIES: nucleotide sugar dehydrogenase [Rhodanobacter]|uniref:nucleotide sugar dehydrogenase n=1 Tax=Rhodanobacter TaxID=75309 RepID=UPI000422E320|nr:MULTISPECIES: nucleotide sugar dehydrogenase [Rhodanobacter]KZC19225.1 Vi polysaccharide biosynthesis protein VipA/TviB [Rhodanobacter denitrificans]UJJ50477.1 nucleotide sugar dehydrogenase [Rhodanobacter denitrificans]UJM93192.1 nucleotide sugar dehydrogenase [Rhodanobacter denitrificans]UJM96724.1 nucleotide sugar dehydrogenase [Rhodanobacter denitrificans]UJN20447.1 nucleotide sugar dehydrogenase [Rhodanobacter denitrificans]
MNEPRIAIIGLGYVGLPLAVAFGRLLDTVGFDTSVGRVDELCRGRDHTLETSAEELAAADRLRFTTDVQDIAPCNVFIVTVPTPVDEANRPDMRPLESASASIGSVLKRGDVVIYESTVYPGTTEEICVPVLERASGLRFNHDFTCGYSPERINPGDKLHRLPTIMKITSGSTAETADFVDALYRRIITAGTHQASSIKVAEAAKVIENTQRDVNIALVNELAMIFNTMGIDTQDVLDAAGTKWNFLPFKPGLVGGHCIGVDPYYLTHKATILGYNAELILTARRINSRMGLHVAHRVMRLMANKRIHVVDSRILVLGLTFKENCPDLRNTRVVEIVRELETAHARVDVYDPWADPAEAEEKLGIRPIDAPTAGSYDAIVLAVAHQAFLDLGSEGIRRFGREHCALFDIKSLLPATTVDGRL